MAVSEKIANQVLTSENAADFYFKELDLLASTPEPADTAPVVETELLEDAEPVEITLEDKPATVTEEKKANPKLEKRFSEITKQREAARQDAQLARDARDAMEIRLKAYEFQGAGIKAPAPEVNSKPRPDQFSDAFVYAEKLAEWSVDNALKNSKAADERQKVLTTWQQKLESTKAELPDYDELVNSSDVIVGDHIRDAIIESDVGARILYHLAENPEIAAKLSGMSMSSSLRELGRLEAKFEKASPAQAKTSRIDSVIGRDKAPEPISVLKSTSSNIGANISPNGEFNGTYQEWKAARKAGKVR